MTFISQIERIESTNKQWEPTKFIRPASQQIHPVVHRSLQLRELEIDVQEWTDTFLEPMTGFDQRYLRDVLEGHSNDENNHELVLGYLCDYWGGVEVSDEAKQVIQMWRDLPGDVLAKKTFLEAGVFFSLLPLITHYSNYDVYTSRVADWILNDEARHVRVARVLMKEFGIKAKREYLTAIETTLRFILQSEPTEEQDKWVARSQKIVLKGEADDFAEYSLRSVPGHFDINHRGEVSNGYSY